MVALRASVVYLVSAAPLLASDPPAAAVPAWHMEGLPAVPTVSDLNLDGLPDLVAGGGEVISVRLGLGGGDFGPALVFEAPIDDEDVGQPAVGDFDEDGIPDLALWQSGIVTESPVHPLGIFRGAGDGSFALLAQISQGTGCSTPLVLDADGDGHLDITLLRGDIGLRLHTGAGDGSFIIAADLPQPFAATAVAGGDLDLDGDTDLVTWDYQLPKLHITLVGGPSLLTALPDATLAAPASGAAVAQVVGSALPDIVVSSSAAFTATSVVRNFGATTFAPQPGLADTSGWEQIAVTDFTGDGVADLIGVVAGSSSYTESSIRLRHGQSGGSFGASSVMPFMTLEAMTVADADLDGLVDVLAVLNDYNGLPGDAAYSDIALLRGRPDGSFATNAVLQGQEGTDGLVAADFTGDGQQDVAALVASTSQVGVHVGDGAGGLQPLAFTLIQPADVPVAGVAMDFDADGDVDLATSLSPLSATTVFRNAGSPHLTFAQQVPGGRAGLAAGDVTGDGLPDLVLAIPDDGNPFLPALEGVRLAEGFGDGTFAASILYGDGQSIRSLDLGDADLDGDLDVVTSAWDDDRVRVLRNIDGVLSAVTVLDLPESAGEVRVGDLDEDGAADVVVANGGLRVLIGNGSLGFSSNVLHGFTSVAESVRLGDMDGDSHLDVVADDGFAVVQCALGDGTGDLPSSWRSTAAASVWDLCVVDLDGAGPREVLTSSGFADLPRLTHVRQAEPATWTALPAGKPGVAGVPVLQGFGTLQGGSALTLALSHAAPLAPVALVVGLTRLDAPLKGGLLVPSPDLLSVGLGTDGAGSLPLSSTWPTGLPSGLELYLQAWVTDAAATHGLSATPGLRALTP